MSKLVLSVSLGTTIAENMWIDEDADDDLNFFEGAHLCTDWSGASPTQ